MLCTECEWLTGTQSSSLLSQFWRQQKTQDHASAQVELRLDWERNYSFHPGSASLPPLLSSLLTPLPFGFSLSLSLPLSLSPCLPPSHCEQPTSLTEAAAAACNRAQTTNSVVSSTSSSATKSGAKWIQAQWINRTWPDTCGIWRGGNSCCDCEATKLLRRTAQ